MFMIVYILNSSVKFIYIIFLKPNSVSSYFFFLFFTREEKHTNHSKLQET